MSVADDKKLGLSGGEVLALCQKHGRTLDDFYGWMGGQTVAMDSSGQARYYRHDVERFMRLGPRAPVED